MIDDEAMAEATERARAQWCAMTEDERRTLLRAKMAKNPPPDTQLADAYIEYVATVSPDWMAMSFAAAAFLAGLCLDRAPMVVADFGSGFSSYVLRRYATLLGATVFSVDDSPEWLEHTRDFLASQGLATDGLMTWDEWVADCDTPLDLAFHDLASGELREAAMPIIADRMRVGGVIMFDDANHGDHFEAMKTVARDHGWLLACLPETMDGNGRFDALVECRAVSVP